MKEVSINDLKAGECLEKDIYDSRKRLLLKKGTILIEELISSLQSKGLESIYIESDEPPQEEEVDNKIANMLSIAETGTEMMTAYDHMFYEMRRIVLRGTYKKVIQENLKQEIAYFLDVILKKDDRSVIKFLLHIKSIYPDYRFEAHSLNTAIISILLGKWLEDEHIRLDELFLAGCLHDIGEFSVPREVYNKREHLTESDWEQIKKHPLYGAQILNKTPWINNRVVDAVIKHHERLDGTGYPLSCLGSQIPIMPRIIYVAGAYDSMTTNRPYKRAVSQFEALSELRNRSFGQLDARITRLLYDKMLAFYAGKEVVLSNDDSGVVALTAHKSKRPYIKGLADNYDLTLKDAPEIKMVIN